MHIHIDIDSIIIFLIGGVRFILRIFSIIVTISIRITTTIITIFIIITVITILEVVSRALVARDGKGFAHFCIPSTKSRCMHKLKLQEVLFCPMAELGLGVASLLCHQDHAYT